VADKAKNDDKAALTSPHAHPDFIAAAGKVSGLAAKLDEIKREVDGIKLRHKITKADPRRGAALRMVGRDSEADAHERLADLEPQAAVFAEAVELATKERAATLARLVNELSAEAYRDVYVPVAREAVAAFVELAKKWDRARAVKREIQSFGLTAGRLSPVAPTEFTTTAYPATAEPDMNGVDPLRRLLNEWIDAGFLDIEDARAEFPAVPRL
jgi:hypothetical protein